MFLYSTLRENMMNDVLSNNCLIKWKDIPICLVLGECIGQEPAGSRWLIQASVLVNSSTLVSHYLPGKPRECCSVPGPLWRLGCLLPPEDMSGAGRPWLLEARTESHTEWATLRGAVSLGGKMQPAQSSPTGRMPKEARPWLHSPPTHRPAAGAPLWLVLQDI